MTWFVVGYIAGIATALAIGWYLSQTPRYRG